MKYLQNLPSGCPTIRWRSACLVRFRSTLWGDVTTVGTVGRQVNDQRIFWLLKIYCTSLFNMLHKSYITTELIFVTNIWWTMLSHSIFIAHYCKRCCTEQYNYWIYLCYRYTVDDARPTLFPCLTSTTWPLYACVTTASCSRSRPLLSTNEKTPYRWSRNVTSFVSSYCIMSNVQMCKLFCFWFFLFVLFFSFCWKDLLQCKQCLCVYYWFFIVIAHKLSRTFDVVVMKNNQWNWTKDPCNQQIRIFLLDAM